MRTSTDPGRPDISDAAISHEPLTKMRSPAIGKDCRVAHVLAPKDGESMHVFHRAQTAFNDGGPLLAMTGGGTLTAPSSAVPVVLRRVGGLTRGR